MDYLAEESKRKLASIQLIKELKPIKGADFIELAVVNGWQCVVKKGTFKEGDKCVYFEIDSLLPIEDKYSFLEKSSYRKPNSTNPEGYRLRTVKLREQISQGLVLPLTSFEEDLSNLDIGEDVTKRLGVRKYEIPVTNSGVGISSGEYSPLTSKTDEPRVQSNLELLDELKGKPYYMTVKYDGSSMTITYINGELRVYSRTKEYARPKESQLTSNKRESSLWYVVEKLGIEEKLKGYNKDIILKGEYIGPGVQKNLLGLKDLSLALFTIEKPVQENGKQFKRVSYHEFVTVSRELGLPTVDIEEVGDSFDYSIGELVEKSKGRYSSGKHREGLVIRPQYSLEDNELSFKVINNDYLLKEED